MKSIDKAYEEILSFLFSQLPMYQRVGAKAFKKDLTNIILLLEGLGNPHFSLKAIHIAGTNGKGTVSFLLAAILQAQGYSTGLYVSPHYKDFRERVRINGVYVPKTYIIDFVQQNKSLFLEIKPSFFEISVALAFSYFKSQKVDVAIIETGLGGRLDSTNVLEPILSIITNISLDHTNFLGETLPLIATEKAGIIKKAVPLVVGKKQKETQLVFEETAYRKGAAIYYAADNYSVLPLFERLNSTFHTVKKGTEVLFDCLEVNLKGPFQAENIQTVLMACDLLNSIPNGLEIEESSILKGFKELKHLTKYIGRWHILGEAPTIIADSGHNEAAVQQVVSELQKNEYHTLHIIWGMVNDKDSSKILSLLPKEAAYYFAKANIPRGLDAEILKERAALCGLNGTAFASVSTAFSAAQSNAKSNDLIFIGGSIFVIAEVL